MIDIEKRREKKRAYMKELHVKAKLAYNALMKFYPLELDNLPDESWLEIEGIDGMYQISTYSRVKSFKRGLPKILKPLLNGYYLSVSLRINGKRKNCNIHIMAARAFIPNPEGKPEVNHRDGNKFNCFVGNLEWATHSENIEHAYSTGLQKLKHGVENPNAVLTEDQVLEILDICILGDREFGASALARKYGVSTNVINCVVHGKTYKNVPRPVDKSGEKS